MPIISLQECAPRVKPGARVQCKKHSNYWSERPWSEILTHKRPNTNETASITFKKHKGGYRERNLANLFLPELEPFSDEGKRKWETECCQILKLKVRLWVRANLVLSTIAIMAFLLTFNSLYQRMLIPNTCFIPSSVVFKASWRLVFSSGVAFCIKLEWISAPSFINSVHQNKTEMTLEQRRITFQLGGSQNFLRLHSHFSN